MRKRRRNWKKISGKIVYKNPWIIIHEDKVLRPDGKVGMYGYLEKPVGVFTVVYDDKKDTVLFIRQHRYPINKVILEIPAGVSENGNYLDEAKRELYEETGIKAKVWKHLGGAFVASGHESTRIEVFLAMELIRKEAKISHQESDEAIAEMVELRLVDLPDYIMDGKIECSLALTSLNYFFMWKKKNRQ